MIIGILAAAVAVQRSAGKHDAAEDKVGFLVPAGGKRDGADGVFHSRVLAKGFVKREEGPGEHSRAGQGDRNTPKRYAKHPALEDTSGGEALLRSVARSRFFTAQFLGEDNGFGQLLHGAAQTPAFVAHAQIGFLLAEVLPALEDALGALDDFACFELTLDFGGFLREPNVLLLQEALA